MTEILVQRLGAGQEVPQSALAGLSVSSALLLMDDSDKLEGEARTVVLMQYDNQEKFVVEAQGPKSVGFAYITSLLEQGNWVLLTRQSAPR